MKRLLAGLFGFALIAAACGGDSDSDVATDAPAGEGDEAGEEPAEEPTADETPAEEPEPTAAPEPTATPEPEPTPVLVNAVGLQPLPGALLDFTGALVEVPSLVWSLYSGSGGVIVENVGGPLPPGCHGTSFFDPETFELLQIDGEDAHAYASRGEAGCDNMQQDLEEGVVDGDTVKVNDDDLIQFDFGALPPPPFDVSTQIVNPDGNNGIFRAADPEDPLVAKDLTGATHVLGVSGLFDLDPDTGLLRRVNQPDPAPGPGCAEFTLCLKDRFQIEIVNAEGSPGSVLTSDEQGGLFFFFSPDEVDALVSIVNGCGLNQHFWVHAAAATDVEFDLTVTDTSTGESRLYFNPLGQLPEPITDTEAFATCP